MIIDHGKGFTTLITHLGELSVARGDAVAKGQLLGRTGGRRSEVTVELRRRGVPHAIAPLVGG